MNVGVDIGSRGVGDASGVGDGLAVAVGDGDGDAARDDGSATAAGDKERTNGRTISGQIKDDRWRIKYDVPVSDGLRDDAYDMAPARTSG